MVKKGQAALEFLMTYGWAILVVLAAIGVLAYFGVMSPGKLVPDRCTLGPGLDIKDCKVSSSGGLQLSIYNGLGVDMTTISTVITPTAGSVASACTGAESVNVTAYLASGQTSGMMTFCTTELASASDGQRFDADIEIIYMKGGSNLNHTITGKIQRKVEQ